MMKIAITGASGFIGSRLVENLVLNRKAEVIPIVRRYSSLAVSARFNLASKVCNIFDQGSLASAFSGCDAVIHAALGDAKQIVDMAECVYWAAEKAHVKRISVLSTASIYGFVPNEGTDEDSPVRAGHNSSYINAKILADRVFRKLGRRGNVEIVYLLPSIVYGPRSRFITGLVEQLLAKSAFLVNRGQGIFNGLYVDNLIDAIWLSLENPDLNGEAFLLNDAENLNWHQLYKTLVDAIGIDYNTVHDITPPEFRKTSQEKIAEIIATPIVQKILPLIPDRAKRLTKAMIAAWEPFPHLNAWAIPNNPQPRINQELCELQQCNWKFPSAKAQKTLNYVPSVSFNEGMRKTLAWVDFARR